MRLLHIMRRHILPPVAKPLPQLLQLRLLHCRRLPESGSNGLPRQIILRRPQPAGRKDDVRPRHPPPESIRQHPQIIPDDTHPLQLNPQRRQPPRNPAGIGIGKFPHQQLRADGNNLRLHRQPPFNKAASVPARQPNFTVITTPNPASRRSSCHSGQRFRLGGLTSVVIPAQAGIWLVGSDGSPAKPPKKKRYRHSGASRNPAASYGLRPCPRTGFTP